MKSFALKEYHSVSRCIDLSELCFLEYTFLILLYIRVDRVARKANTDIPGVASIICLNTGHAQVCAFS